MILIIENTNHLNDIYIMYVVLTFIIIGAVSEIY